MPKCADCKHQGPYVELETPYPIDQMMGMKLGIPGGVSVSLIGFEEEAGKYGFTREDLSRKAMNCQAPGGGPTTDPIVLIQALTDQPCDFYAPRETTAVKQGEREGRPGSLGGEVRYCKAYNTNVNIQRLPKDAAVILACENTCTGGAFECTRKCYYGIGIQMGALVGMEMSEIATAADGTVPLFVLQRLGASIGAMDYTSKIESPKPTEAAKPVKEQKLALEYFEVPEANPGQDGICSDNECPCGYPGTKIPRGQGYMYISRAVVDFRKDARTIREAESKMALMEKTSNAFVMFDQNVVSPTLMCEQGARKRGLDMVVAAADAKHWWETGLAPLRETPLAHKPGVKAAAQQPVFSQPVIVKQPASGTTTKSPFLAAILSFFFLGGVGQLYLGQWKKALALMAGSFFLNFVFIGIFVYLLGIGDAYGTAKKINAGIPVGEWQFNINWMAVLLATLFLVTVVCGLAVLVALTQGG